MSVFRDSDVRPIVILVLLWMVFFWRILTPIASDQASFKQGDFSGQFVAFGAYQYERMSQGEIPLWNPYNNGGLPFIGDTQAAVFYPPRLLTIALASLAGGWSYHALELEAIFHVLLYSLLMYAFLRQLTGSIWGAFTGAVIASYGGFTVGYPLLQLAILEAGTWLPLGALCIYQATRKNNIQWLYLIFAGFALGLSWMAGHPQTSWFLTYFLVAWLAYCIYDKHHHWRNLVLGTILLGIISLGTTAITFLPAIEYLTMTVRSGLGFDAKANGFPFQDIAQLIFPNSVSLFSPLYVGIPALLLIAIATFTRWKQSRFWVIVTVIALLLSFGGNTGLYHALYNILPGLRFFRGQERVVFLIANCLAVLASIGMTGLMAGILEKHKSLILKILNGLVLLIGGFTALIYIGWWGNVGDGFGRLISIFAFSTLIVLVLWILIRLYLQMPTNQLLIVLLIALITFELFSVNLDADSNYDPIPASEQLSMSAPPLVQAVIDDASSQPYRVDGFRGLRDNYGSLYQIMDIRGISPLFLETPSAIIYRDYVNNPRAWEVFAVRYIFSERDSFGQISTDVIAQGTDQDGQVFLHQIDNPRPFAHLVYDFAVVGSDDHAIELLYDPNFLARDSVILQQEPTLSLPDNRPERAIATVTDFEPERVIIEVETDDNTILSLAMVDYSGWSATLDDEPVEILRAYGSLSAIEIPSGTHTVVLTYNPLSYRVGAI
ncbi:MAG: YfhO family protein, partial [Chloroflexota bacterium]